MLGQKTFDLPQVESYSHTWNRSILAVLVGSVLITLSGYISIPLPFTPVPLALRPQMCMFLGLLLGSSRGAWAVLLFIAQGIAGLPVFALGKAGLAVLAGPTGGYIVGY